MQPSDDTNTPPSSKPNISPLSEPNPTPVDQQGASSGKKVLIVEDEKFIADIYSRELIKSNFIVAVAEDGAQGLKSLDTESFDLMLLDILLPNVHGLEVLKQWKTKHPNSPMVILLLTNLGQDEVIKEAFALGAQGYLIKASYTPKQVVTEVQNALGMKPTPPPADQPTGTSISPSDVQNSNS